MLHAGEKLAVDLANTPVAFQVGLEVVFLSTWATPLWEMVSTTPSSTARSANSRKLHWA
jgi:hypothetical protein